MNCFLHLMQITVLDFLLKAFAAVSTLFIVLHLGQRTLAVGTIFELLSKLVEPLYDSLFCPPPLLQTLDNITKMKDVF